MSFLRKSILCGFLAFAGVAAFEGQAAAQQSQLSESARLRARTLYAEAVEAYDVGRYQDALGKWQEAYELTGTKILLFSIGNAAERLGQLDTAIDALEGYKSSLTEKDEINVIELRILGLRDRRQAQIDLEEARQRAIDAELAEQRAKADEAERARMDAEEALFQEQLDALRADPKGLVAVRWTSISLAAAGVIVGATFQLQANNHESQLRERCASTSVADRLLCDDSTSSIWDKRDTARLGSYIAYGSAAGFALIGITTLFIHPNRNKNLDNPSSSSGPARQMSVSPFFTRDGASIHFNARF